MELDTTKSRLEQLEELVKILADEINARPGARDLAQLSKQYRETLAEIEMIKKDGQNDAEDEIARLLADG